ncbi:MAG TPA: CotH kinase family protein [Gemmataceae bacterium]|nr:CotH kinase family protein [Gemmataceae bacterium]
MLLRTALGGLLVALTCGVLAAQPPGVGPPPGGFPPFGPPDGQPPFGGRGPGGPGGPGGMMGQQRKLVKQFDKDGDGRLNKEEREAARAFLKTQGGGGRRGGPGGARGGGFGRGGESGKPGPHVSLGDVTSYPNASLYEPTVLRTLFLDFENKDWEAELQDFHGTDVEVPATLTLDGKRYPNVGVHFRGMSSYMGAGAGSKRSLNLSLDFADPKQRLYGYKTLNLLNSHEDPSFMSTVLYSHVARQYIPTPKANFVKVVINGESWGVYVNAQQFNKEFLNDFYKTTKGTRWKVRGSPGGDGGLRYLGDNVAEYKRRFEIKSTDDPKAWQALIALCKTLDQTPPDQLEAALAPILDVDGLLWFLALDVSLINCDGYWTRASDYSLYLDPKGKFHVVPHDMNECFRPAQGPGMGGPGGPGGFVMRLPQAGEVLPTFIQDMLNLTGEQKRKLAELQKETDARLEKILTAEQRAQIKGFRDGVAGGPGGFGPGPGPGPGGGGPGGRGPGGRGGMGMARSAPLELDPLIGLDDARKPLRSKVLAVPALRAKYLQNVRTIAEKSLDWKSLGPVVAKYRALIAKEVEVDTRKLDSFDAFLRTTADDASGAGGRGFEFPLRTFADQRRKYLLGYKESNAALSSRSPQR